MTNSIELHKVEQNNLKGFDLKVPLQEITVITGVSGSGKSSLAFETLYAEGSRRYIESLSTYARQFLDQMPKPDVEAINNIPPAIALEQRNSISSARTMVADLTELNDFLRLFFAAIARQSCKACGWPEVRMNQVDTITEQIIALPKKTKFYVLAPMDEHSPFMPMKSEEEIETDDRKSVFLGQNLFSAGFQRILVNNNIVDLNTAEGQIFNPTDEEVFILIDRQVVNESLRKDSARLAESIETALLHGNGRIEVRNPEGDSLLVASQGYSCLRCGTLHRPPSPPLFSSNSPLGACNTCNGFGEILELDEELIVPDPNKTLRNGALDPFSKPSYKEWEENILSYCEDNGISAGTRYCDLTEDTKKLLWKGDDDFPGIEGYFEILKQWRYKLHVRVFIRRFQSQRICPSCKGTRLSEDPLRFRVQTAADEDGKSIADILDMTIDEAYSWLKSLTLTEQQKAASRELSRQLYDRLEFMRRVGVGYIKLNRKGNTLSGGEFQRINLAAQLGSKLSQTLYVLDEPSIGLHPSDTERLIAVFKELRDNGNTVVIVEHEPQVMKTADNLIELGPKAGELGGELVASGPSKEFLKSRKSLTAKYLSGEMHIPIPKTRREFNKDKAIRLTNCTANNLKNLDVEFPTGLICAVTGVSGSGKSTLVHDTLYQVLAKLILKENIPSHQVGTFSKAFGVSNIQSVSLLNQTPIGRSQRSSPVTYLKIYDEVRRMMACAPEAVRLSLTPSHFSFNVDGGRCDTCKGDGTVEVDMHFLPNLRITCEDCQGTRFKPHVLDVKYKGKSIYEILRLTVLEALTHFSDIRAITARLSILLDVGLGYLRLGQTLDTLSGGECQRLKVANTLLNQASARRKQNRLFIFDEPTTGLHLHDIKKLAHLFHRLVDEGNSIIFIEHNSELIAQADWVIDLGPAAGEDGGTVIAQGTPEHIAELEKSRTGQFLRPILRTGVLNFAL